MFNRVELARFMRQVRVQPSGCWWWAGDLSPNGYGQHRQGPGAPERYAHVLSYEHHKGPVPAGYQVGHVCHDLALAAGECSGGACEHRRCVNPEHLDAQSRSQNILASDHAERRRTHCPKGHPYDEANTITRGGKRYCRECKKRWRR